ncbi:MAG: DUF1298 domain-containing protein [Bdellovibrionales bacterium]|nr:DUF1298 domain-containing protein [Bdellovibrionales bacterium]
MSERVLPIDEVFFNLDTETTHQQIASLVVLDCPPDLNRFKQDVEKVVSQFPRMRQCVLRGWRPKWIEYAAFKLEEHIRSVDAGGRPLLDAVAEIYSEPMDLSRPLWRFTVVKNAANSESGIYFGLHHTLADGVGGLEWVRTHFSDSRDESAAGKRGGNRVRKDSSTKLPSSFERKMLVSWMHWLLDFVKTSVRGPINGKNSAQRRLHSAKISLADLRHIKLPGGMTKNDVVFAIVAGALKRYSEMRGQPLKVVHVVMPVSLRNVSERFAMGNRLTGVSVPISLEGESPRQRLLDAHEILTEFKQSGVIGAYASLAGLLAKLPARLMRWMSEIQARRTNFILTNMPGEKRPRYVAGAQITENYGIPALMRGHGLAFGFLSYAGTACCVVVTDPKIIPDGEVLAALIEEEAQALLRDVSPEAQAADSLTQRSSAASRSRT